jgi:hypothetical protein
MIPKLHALSKTALELRRQIYRLEEFERSNSNEFVTFNVQEILDQLKQARRLIPKQFLDQDNKVG